MLELGLHETFQTSETLHSAPCSAAIDFVLPAATHTPWSMLMQATTDHSTWTSDQCLGRDLSRDVDLGRLKK